MNTLEDYRQVFIHTFSQRFKLPPDKQRYAPSDDRDFVCMLGVTISRSLDSLEPDCNLEDTVDLIIDAISFRADTLMNYNGYKFYQEDEPDVFKQQFDGELQLVFSCVLNIYDPGGVLK